MPSIRNLVAFVLGALVLMSGLASPARATTEYGYASAPYTFATAQYTTSMFLTLTIELAAPLVAGLSNYDLDPDILSFSVYDGVRTVTDADALNGTDFRVSTNAQADIQAWGIAIDVIHPGDIDVIVVCNGLSAVWGPFASCDMFGEIGASSIPGGAFGGGYAASVGSPGNWSIVPEPNTAFLIAAGLVGLGAWRRKADR